MAEETKTVKQAEVENKQKRKLMYIDVADNKALVDKIKILKLVYGSDNKTILSILEKAIDSLFNTPQHKQKTQEFLKTIGM